MYRAAEPRNILYAITSLDMGGEERHLLQLARYMRERGHAVRVCCLHSRGVNCNRSTFLLPDYR